MDPNQDQQQVLTTVSSGLKKIRLILIGLIVIGIGAYYYFFNNHTEDIVAVESQNQITNNTNTTMEDTTNTQAANSSTLTSDNALISTSILNLMSILLSKDSEALISYTMKPFAAIGSDKDPHVVEIVNNLKAQIQDPKMKFWDVAQAMASNITTEVLDSQLGNCKFREKSDGFPPALERTASCNVTYNIKPLTPTTKINMLKISGTWYVDMSSFDTGITLADLMQLKH